MAQPQSLDPIFEQAGTQWNVDPNLLRAVAMTESGMRTTPDVVSSVGAQGIMQFMPETANQYGVHDPFDPNQAIPGAAHYLSDLLNRAEARGLSGPAAVSHALGGYYGKEDPAYIGTVAKYYRQLAGSPPASGTPEAPQGQSPLYSMFSQATSALPEGYRAVVTSGYRPGSRVAGSGGISQHAHEGGAIDVQIIGPDGKPIPNTGDDSTGLYRQFALAMYHAAPEELRSRVGWGGNFTTGPANGPRDLMHFDLAGDRGRYGTLAQLAQATGGITPTNSMAVPAQGTLPIGQDMSKMPDYMNDPLVQQLISGQLQIPGAQAATPPQAAPTGAEALASTNRPLMDPQQIARIITGTPGGMPGIVGSGNEAALGPLVTALGQGLPREGYMQYAVDPSGRTVMQPVPGAVQASAELHGARARAEALGKLTSQMLLKQLETELANQNTIETHVINGKEIPMTRGEWLRIVAQNPALQPAVNPAQTTPPDQGTGTPSPSQPPGQSPAPPSPSLGVPAKTPETTGATEYEKLQAADLGKTKEAFISNQSSIQNLQNFLEAAQAVGTGKGTEFSAHTAAWLKSLNIDPQKLGLADPVEVGKMRKAATQMVFSTISSVSKRPAYQEFQMLEQGLPNADLQPEANRAIAAALLAKMQWENALYKAWDADRRQSHSAANFDVGAWTAANPMPSFQASALESIPKIPDRQVVGGTRPAPQFQEGQTIRNPQTGARMVYRGGQWVPMQ